MSQNQMQKQTSVNTRRFSRFEPHARTNCWIRIAASEDALPGWVVNLSKTGIAVLLQERFQVGAVFKIKLENEEKYYDRWLTVEVKHSEICYPNETWLHGCVFPKPLDESELQMLAENVPHKGTEIS